MSEYFSELLQIISLKKSSCLSLNALTVQEISEKFMSNDFDLITT